MKLYDTGMNLVEGIAFFIRYKGLQIMEYWLEKNHHIGLAITNNLRFLENDLDEIFRISCIRHKHRVYFNSI